MAEVTEQEAKEANSAFRRPMMYAAYAGFWLWGHGNILAATSVGVAMLFAVIAMTVVQYKLGAIPKARKVGCWTVLDLSSGVIVMSLVVYFWVRELVAL